MTKTEAAAELADAARTFFDCPSSGRHHRALKALITYYAASSDDCPMTTPSPDELIVRLRAVHTAENGRLALVPRRLQEQIADALATAEQTEAELRADLELTQDLKVKHTKEAIAAEQEATELRERCERLTASIQDLWYAYAHNADPDAMTTMFEVALSPTQS